MTDSAPHSSRRSVPPSLRSWLALALTAGMGLGSAAADPLTVAFVGDQGTGSNARSVLRLVVDEGTDLLVLGGDLGYGDSPGNWGRMMDELLGERFPVLSVAGNHDRHDWPDYQRWLENRIDNVDGLDCSGVVGVRAHCTYRGLSVVQTAPGVHDVSEAGPEDDYEGHVDWAFRNDPARWRICSFHKNMRNMQVGDKGDETGWGVYEACRRAGAMVATGHEHSYSRTYLMDDFDALSVVHRESHLVLEEGRSFAFVSGLGGQAVRDQERDGDWWASIYARPQGADHGALFCRFEGDSAQCEFKSVSGAVPDRFTLQSRVGSSAVDSIEQALAAELSIGADAAWPMDVAATDPVMDDPQGQSVAAAYAADAAAEEAQAIDRPPADDEPVARGPSAVGFTTAASVETDGDSVMVGGGAGAGLLLLLTLRSAGLRARARRAGTWRRVDLARRRRIAPARK